MVMVSRMETLLMQRVSARDSPGNTYVTQLECVVMENAVTSPVFRQARSSTDEHTAVYSDTDLHSLSLPHRQYKHLVAAAITITVVAACASAMTYGATKWKERNTQLIPIKQQVTSTINATSTVFSTTRDVIGIDTNKTTDVTNLTTTTAPSAVKNKPPDTSSHTYRGYVSVTDSGRVCQSWSSDKPHRRNEVSLTATNYPDDSISAARNYCRDPDSTGFPWCYTTDPGVRWDKCSVDLLTPPVDVCASVHCPDGTICQQVNNTRHECVCTVKALGTYSQSILGRCVSPDKYTGQLTASSKTCLQWSKTHFSVDVPPNSHNYCRAPRKYPYLFCLTDDKGEEMELCTIDLCGIAQNPCSAI